ncbi:SLC13 family permease, partial [Candidatus Allofournierella excrementavium]
MKQCFQRALGFAKSEAVLSIAALLAVGSMAAVPPDKGYLDYIDWDTLALLFSLMAVSKGLQGQGVFDALGAGLLGRLSTTRQMLLVLTFLPFFVSMLVTNDVALITFVPFGLVVLEMAGCERLAIPLVVLQTAAANLGSMLTPMGNPQNLYLYNRSGMGFLEFCALLAPYAALSAAAIALLALLPKSEAMHTAVQPEGKGSGRRIALFAALGGVCLLCIAKLLPPLAAAELTLAVLLIADRPLLKKLDWALLATFVAFFVFIGNMGRLPAFSAFLAGALAGREVE